MVSAAATDSLYCLVVVINDDIRVLESANFAYNLEGRLATVAIVTDCFAVAD